MLTALLLAASPALAWTHIGYIWNSEEDFPREWYMDDDPEDSLEGVDLGALLQRGWDAWEDAPCAGVSDTYKGVKTATTPDYQDHLNIMYWDDPGDEMAPGVLGVTYPVGSNTTTVRNGRTYKQFTDADIIFNNDVIWDLPENIETSCTVATDIEGVATHEIGHSYGMGHSCEQGETCTDDVLADATMFWSVSACDTHQSDINQDDVDGITALYGVSVDFGATSPRFGAVSDGGLAVSFAIDEDSLTSNNATLKSADWDFGDGETSTESAPTHTYTVEDQYTVSVDFVVNTDLCGDVAYQNVKLGYVLACDTPRPAEGSTGFFQLQQLDDLTFEVLNHTDVSTYGCVNTIQWSIYKGNAVNEANLVTTVGAWTPKLQFPSAGTYLVVMNIGGPGGLVASSLTVDVAPMAGCSSAPGLGASGGLLGLVGLLALRRRRA